MNKAHWVPFNLIFFDCDSTLSRIEGIDELARAKGMFAEIKRLTDAAMEGEVHLESVYDERLQRLRPTRGEIKRVENLYRQTLVPDARETIAALRSLQKQVFIVSGGLYEAVLPFGQWLGVPTKNIRAVKIKYNALSGEWWNYVKDHWGNRPDVNYLKHHQDDPLVQSRGKAEVVRRLKRGLPGKSMLIGDGMSDLAARPEVDLLVGFGGVVSRPGVASGADIFISANSLSPALVLATSAQERQTLSPAHQETLRKGLHLIKKGALSFKSTKWKQAVL